MSDESIRAFSMIDADLSMFSIFLIGFINRDIVEFNDMGINATELNTYKDFVNAFKYLPNDEYYRSDIFISINAKNKYRDNTEIMVRAIVGRAKIKWGDRSAQVKRFKVGKMTNINDKGFLTMCRQVVEVAEDYLSELASQGLTQLMINEMAAEAQLMENELYMIAKKEATRDIKTQERIASGNELYSYVTRYCEIGKIIWQDTDEAKYNDYIIYNRRPSKPTEVQSLDNNVDSNSNDIENES